MANRCLQASLMLIGAESEGGTHLLEDCGGHRTDLPLPGCGWEEEEEEEEVMSQQATVGVDVDGDAQ
ncbi:hypothetical protein GW17_00055766 [Ensete ventricosum]|nr:hypothetical protein GW17_00055766 [Ensete ventricosum]